MKSLLRSRQAQAVLPWLLGTYLGFVLRTTRWTLDGAEYLVPHAAGSPAIVAFWHEFLPLLPILPRLAGKLPQFKATPIHALVSQHRDGRIIGAVVRRFGIMPILGSSSRGGAAAMRNLLSALSKGEIVSITPDGPRGPRRHAAPGVAQLAAIAGVPILPCAARTNRRILLNTWDKMPVPLPFGRGVMVCGPALIIPRDNWEDAVPMINEALDQVTNRADALCAA